MIPALFPPSAVLHIRGLWDWVVFQPQERRQITLQRVYQTLFLNKCLSVCHTRSLLLGAPTSSPSKNTALGSECPALRGRMDLCPCVSRSTGFGIIGYVAAWASGQECFIQSALCVKCSQMLCWFPYLFHLQGKPFRSVSWELSSHLQWQPVESKWERNAKNCLANQM